MKLIAAIEKARHTRGLPAGQYMAAYEGGWRTAKNGRGDLDSNPHRDPAMQEAWTDGYMDSSCGRDQVKWATPLLGYPRASQYNGGVHLDGGVWLAEYLAAKQGLGVVR